MAKALAAAAIAGLVLGVGGASGKPVAVRKCLFTIHYDDSVYYAVSSENVTPGRRVGRAFRQSCNDIGGPPPPARPVEAFRFGSANPRVALVVSEARRPHLIVAVPGRCSGYAPERSYLRCLQTEVRFRGRGYTAVRGVPLRAARTLAPGVSRGRTVRLRAIQGIDPRIAVLRASTRELLVAHRRCEFQPSDRNFARCLRSPLWLEITGEGRFRTGLVDAPGALVRSSELPLYLAEDAIADQIVSAADERLTPAGRLTVDGRGRGTARIGIADSAVSGLLAVVAQLPGGRMVVVGSLWNPPRRD
jgi:Family of unknown function (DUF6281)